MDLFDDDEMGFFQETQQEIYEALEDTQASSALLIMITTLATVTEILSECPPHMRASVAQAIYDQMSFLMSDMKPEEREATERLMGAMLCDPEQRCVEAEELEIFVDDIARN